MRTHIAVLIVGVLLGFATLTATNGLAAQEPTVASGRVQIADQAATMHVATPTATDTETEMAEKMERMMDQCLAMMEMMSMMMGGDMSGMMGGEEMQGMEGMEDMPAAAATPEP